MLLQSYTNNLVAGAGLQGKRPGRKKKESLQTATERSRRTELFSGLKLRHEPLTG